MANVTGKNAYSIKIESVLVQADRFPESFEIGQSVAEINIFENLDLPYLTGTVLVTDSANILNRINFQGSEKITLKLSVEDDRARSITKTFFVTTVAGAAPVNDMSEVMTLNIIEDFAFISRMNVISRAYFGKPEEIISKIVFDGMKKNVSVPKEFAGSAVPPLKVIVPSMTPLAAAKWIKNRMVTENGCPFFLYSTLNGPNLFLTDLEFMLQKTALNARRPYSYGQAFTNFSSVLGVDEQARVIETYRTAKTENLFKIAEIGGLNSNYTFIDTNKSTSQEQKVTKIQFDEIINNLVQKGIMSREQVGSIYDDKLLLNEIGIKEYTASNISQIVPSNTFTDFANYYESDDIEQHKKRMQSRLLRYYILKSSIEFLVPGWDFLGRGENTTIGNQIRVNILKNDPQVSQRNTSVLDEKRSGDYLIYSLRHIIQRERYSVSMTCGRLGSKLNG